MLSVKVRGKELKLTAEHPFFTLRNGWTEAYKLLPGDLVRGIAEEWHEIEFIRECTEQEVVYNLEVEETHTFFVGGVDWGFAVWVHNVDADGCEPEQGKRWTQGTDNEEQLRGIEENAERQRGERPSIEDENDEWEGAKKRPKQSGIESVDKSERRADHFRNRNGGGRPRR